MLARICYCFVSYFRTINFITLFVFQSLPVLAEERVVPRFTPVFRRYFVLSLVTASDLLIRLLLLLRVRSGSFR